MKIKNGRLIIDLINLFLGIGTIVLAIIIFTSEPMDRSLFPAVFMLGTIMLSLNATRFYQEHRIISAIFAVFSLVFALFMILSLLKIAFGF